MMDPIKLVVEELNGKTESFWREVVNNLTQDVITILRDKFENHGYYGFRGTHGVRIKIDEIQNNFSGFNLDIFPSDFPIQVDEAYTLHLSEELDPDFNLGVTLRECYTNIPHPQSLVDFVNVLMENDFDVYFQRGARHLFLIYPV